MDFEFSEEHKMLREAIRNFAEKEIAPLVEEAEEKEQFPVELFPRMGELGYLCLSYPAEYGAAGMGLIGACIAVEELAKVCAGITGGIMVQSGIATESILAHGNEEQKQKYLIPAIKGERIACFGLTEPNAGSDAAAIETTAVKKNDKYTIFKYGEWEYIKSLNKYKWCSRYETYSATKDYIPAETFIISLVKIVIVIMNSTINNVVSLIFLPKNQNVIHERILILWN